MKNFVSKLLVISAVLFICVLILFLCLRKFGPGREDASASADDASPEAVENVEDLDIPDADNRVVEADKSAAGNVDAGSSVAAAGTAVGTAAAGNAAEANNASAGNGTDGKLAADLVADSGSSDLSAAGIAAAGNASEGNNASAGNRTGGKNAADSGSVADSGSEDTQSSGKKETASISKKPVDVSEQNAASGAGGAFPSSRRDTAFSGEMSRPSTDVGAPATFRGSDLFQYFEYQVITVPKKTLAAAAESMGLPKDSPPSDELLPAIYKAGGYRVIGYSSGYADANVPVEFKMARSEFFPVFYILPKEQSDEPYVKDNNPHELPPPDLDEEDDGDDGSDDEGDDGEYDDGDTEDDEDWEDDESSDFMNSYNNLAGVFPFFGDPTTYGNEFFLDIRPPRLFLLESSMSKLNGFSNTDYGDWGEAQAPIFDDNSFANTLSSTKGKPMIIAKSSTSNAWTLHVFFTQAVPAPEQMTPAAGSENKIVRLDFQIVRAKWTELLAAGESDGCPGLPSDKILGNLSKSSQLRDLYSPSFRLIPSQEPVFIRLNSKTQSVPLKWIPAQDPGIPAIPLNSETIWTGTVLQASARILGDGGTVRLDYRFEKTSQTGWRNYGYSFYDVPQEDSGPTIIVQNDRYARPLQQSLPQQLEPEIRTALLKLPMIDTTAFRQALYLEVGKPMLAARISNPAYQPDMLTLLFVTATVEDAP